LVAFWFDQDELSDAWFKRHVGDQIANAGPRYTRELNIEVPIHSHFHWLLRDDVAVRILQKSSAEAVKTLRNLRNRVLQNLPSESSVDISAAADDLIRLVSHPPADPVDGLRISEIHSVCTAVQNRILELENRVRVHPKAADWKGPSVEYDRYSGHPFKETLELIDRASGA